METLTGMLRLKLQIKFILIQVKEKLLNRGMIIVQRKCFRQEQFYLHLVPE